MKTKVSLIILLGLTFSGFYVVAQQKLVMNDKSGIQESYENPNVFAGYNDGLAYYTTQDNGTLNYFTVNREGLVGKEVGLHLGLDKKLKNVLAIGLQFLFGQVYLCYKAYSPTDGSWKIYLTELPRDGKINNDNAHVVQEIKGKEIDNPDPKFIYSQDSSEVVMLTNYYNGKGLGKATGVILSLKSMYVQLLTEGIHAKDKGSFDAVLDNNKPFGFKAAFYNQGKLAIVVNGYSRDMLGNWTDGNSDGTILRYDLDNKSVKFEELPTTNSFRYKTARVKDNTLYLFGISLADNNLNGYVYAQYDIQNGQFSVKDIPISTNMLNKLYKKWTLKKLVLGYSIDFYPTINLLSNGSVMISVVCGNKDALPKNYTYAIDVFKFDAEQKIAWRNFYAIGHNFRSISCANKTTYLYLIEDKKYDKGTGKSFSDIIESEIAEDGSSKENIVYQCDGFSPWMRAFGGIGNDALLFELTKGGVPGAANFASLKLE